MYKYAAGCQNIMHKQASRSISDNAICTGGIYSREGYFSSQYKRKAGSFWTTRLNLKESVSFDLLRHRSDQLVSLGFLVGSAVGMDGTDLGGLVEDAGKLAGEFDGGGIVGLNGGAQLLLDGFDLADAGAVTQVGLTAGADALDGRLHMSHS